MGDSIRTAKYYAPNYTELPTRQCLVCGTLENHSASIVNTGIPWLCDRCKNTLLKLIKDFNTASNTSNALNALDCVEERKKGKWEDNTKDGGWKCSECGFTSYSVGFYKRYKTKYRMRFCPNCGAEMRKE